MLVLAFTTKFRSSSKNCLKSSGVRKNTFVYPRVYGLYRDALEERIVQSPAIDSLLLLGVFAFEPGTVFWSLTQNHMFRILGKHKLCLKHLYIYIYTHLYTYIYQISVHLSVEGFLRWFLVKKKHSRIGRAVLCEIDKHFLPAPTGNSITAK